MKIEVIHQWAIRNDLVGDTVGSEADEYGGHAYRFTSARSNDIIIGGLTSTLVNRNDTSAL